MQRKKESDLVKIVTESDGKVINVGNLAWLKEKTGLLLLTDNRLYDNKEIMKIDPFLPEKSVYGNPLEAEYAKQLKNAGFKIEYIEHSGLAERFLAVHSEYIMRKIVIKNWDKMKPGLNNTRQCTVRMPTGEIRSYSIHGSIEEHKEDLESAKEELDLCAASRISYMMPKINKHIEQKSNFALLINKAELNANSLQAMLKSHEHIIYSSDGSIISYDAAQKSIA